ncbi:MAG: hypothetical protein ACOH1V_06805 [Stenotrophomonas sp.]
MRQHRRHHHQARRARRRLRATGGQARMAPVAREGLWIYGYFEETKLPRFHSGDAVDIRLMAGGLHLRGTGEGIATGVADAAGPTGQNQLTSGTDLQPGAAGAARAGAGQH